MIKSTAMIGSRTWTAPYAPWPEIEEMQRDDGSHPLWDRDDLQDVYRDWRQVFNAYDPPRFAVAEASVHPSRRSRYAAPTSLGQAFNFAMQDAAWRVQDYREVIETGLADMITEGSTTTWLLGCHDTPRVVSRYGLPVTEEQSPVLVARSWLLTDGTEPHCDVEVGTRVEFAPRSWCCSRCPDRCTSTRARNWVCRRCRTCP